MHRSKRCCTLAQPFLRPFFTLIPHIRYFQADLNIRKSRQCAFIQTRILLPTAAFAGPPYLITRWCFIRVIESGLPERGIQELFCCLTLFGGRFSRALNGRANSTLAGSAKPAGPLYKTRAEWVPKLAAEFRMNDWTQRFTLEETAAIYQRSRIVVNIGRDDFPQDANLRVFEVLASGALLITSLPSELTQLGFQNGVHFVGYRDHSDLIGIVRRYLADEASRSKIAEAARSLALSEHTQDS